MPPKDYENNDLSIRAEASMMQKLIKDAIRAKEALGKELKRLKIRLNNATNKVEIDILLSKINELKEMI